MGRKNYGTAEGLTEKQKSFVHRVMDPETRTITQAYREIYHPKGMSVAQRKAQANEASRLWNHPGILDYAGQVRRTMAADRARSLRGERDRVRDRLWAEVEQAERSSDRIAALRLLGSQTGVSMFTERLQVAGTVTEEISDAEVIAEIEAMRRAREESSTNAVTDVSAVEDSTNTVKLGLPVGGVEDSTNTVILGLLPANVESSTNTVIHGLRESGVESSTNTVMDPEVSPGD